MVLITAPHRLRSLSDTSSSSNSASTATNDSAANGRASTIATSIGGSSRDSSSIIISGSSSNSSTGATPTDLRQPLELPLVEATVLAEAGERGHALKVHAVQAGDDVSGVLKAGLLGTGGIGGSAD
jgi:hypothetical protein